MTRLVSIGGEPLREATEAEFAEAVELSKMPERFAAQAASEEAHDAATVEAAAREKAAVLSRLAEAFDVCGKAEQDAPLLVLRCSAATVLENRDEAAAIDDLVTSLRQIFQGPVLVVPHDWTQEQIDVEAARGLVHEEREACAALAESLAGDMSAAVPVEGGAALVWFAAQLRARGPK